MTRGEFLKVKCDECDNEQIVFNKPAEDVDCLVCDEPLVESTGGKARFRSRVVTMVS